MKTLDKPKLMLTAILLITISFPLIPNTKASTLTITVSTNQQYYLISESITVYGTLTYNSIPVQDWTVALEIQDPNNTPIVTRTLQTDTNGTYTLTFKLPPNAKLGTYTAYASTSYKGETATNNTKFQVTPVKNINTQLGYMTIQQAINAPETFNGHTIFVSTGTYHEHVTISKSLTLIGENVETTIIDGSNTGDVVYINGNKITVTGFTIQKGGSYGDGIHISYSSGIMISNNIILESQHGVYASQSSNISITNNFVLNNGVVGIGGAGIQLFHSSYSCIVGNRVANNTIDGIIVSESSHNCFIANNTVSNTFTHHGISIWDSSSNNTVTNNIVYGSEMGGLFIGRSSCNNVLANNIAYDNQFGIGIWSAFPSNNTIYENIVRNNTIGISLQDAGQNRLYHNNFIDNQQQVSTLNSTNTWDDSYPSGGNYWSDYHGLDLYCNPFQNETGSDGIGDTPYVIDANNTDRYPLSKPYPWGLHDIGVTSLTTSKTVVGQGYNLTISTIMFNYGNSTENFNLTVYANATIIYETTVNLTSRNSTTIILTWNTTDFAKGNYTIWAYAWPVPGETDTADNTFTDGVIYVGIPGDVNMDKKVDMMDIGWICLAYGSYPGCPNWNPNMDINNDNKVDMIDIGFACVHYGETDP